MKTLSLDLTLATIQKLFQEGKCLTFSYQHIPAQLNYEMNLEYEFKQKYHLKKAWSLSNLATLAFDTYSQPFHFFSNGVLIHNFDPTKDNTPKLKKIERMLELHGYKIKEIYGPQTPFEYFIYDSFLRQINDFALLEYIPETHLEVIKLPDKKTFVQNCFAKGQVLLTSSKHSGIDPKVRDYIALLDDGSFYVSEDYSPKNPIKNPSIISHFMREYPNFYYLKRRYVPQDYLSALDEKAKSFDWYLPAQTAVDLKTSEREFSETALKEAGDYMQTLFNGRKCISITNPPIKEGDYKPEHDTYVLFDDGKLLISTALPNPADRFLIQSIEHCFQNLKLDVEYVDSYYIDLIYQEVAKVQKTAKEIYIEILKQKARALKKMLQIPHHEALELSAQIVGFKSWKDALSINEDNARYAIERENEKKKYALEKGKNPIEREYRLHLNNKC